jgi:hypothetical protein
VESLWAGRSKGSPEDPGPGADCGFAAPQLKVSSGPNTVERIIIHISSAAYGRSRGSPGGSQSSRNSPGGVVKEFKNFIQIVNYSNY